MTIYNSQHSSHQSKGFSLLEAIVTLLIVSFGLLGAVGLQMKSQQFSRGAYFHTQATIVAHDMLERMRANYVGLQNSHYHLPTATKHVSCYKKTGCSMQQMAENDMYEWREITLQKMPRGVAVVCIDSSPNDGTSISHSCDGIGNIYAIKVWWFNQNAMEERIVTTVAFN